MLVSTKLKASPLGVRINQGSLKATTVDAELFSILSNHMIRVSAPHPRRREGQNSAQLTTILCGYLVPFVWVPGSFCTPLLPAIRCVRRIWCSEIAVCESMPLPVQTSSEGLKNGMGGKKSK
ncbi:hypothetical protein PBY51_018959 [Eleginops maclovinus]|uniref:Uncharacterized protein n=1 Tax=Eleginops maclovinus TaxID=56733 RepID=A0AAN7Y901_ELEMC|nr:hypothetical protein PBY51_018959 [Eleginops maclovinus]